MSRITTNKIVRRTQLPGYRTEDDPVTHTRKFRIHRRVARLIRKYGGRVLRFRDLPPEAQMALVQYMAVDGEAWEQTRSIETAAYPMDPIPWERVLRRSLPFYVRRYGSTPFGYIPALPIKALIASILQDEDVVNGANWQERPKGYIPKHTAPGKNPWPVILSSFDTETLQDGWTRFRQYAERGLETTPAIWYVPTSHKWKK